MTEQQKAIVGIVISPDEKGYFSNGLHQNAFNLYRLLQQVPLVTPILMCSPMSTQDSNSTSEQEGTLFGEPIYNIELFIEKYHVDIILFVSVVLNEQYMKPFLKRGVKTVAVIYGNRYAIDQEVACFGHLKPYDENSKNHAAGDMIREDLRPDAVWISPHFAYSKDYIKRRYRAKSVFVCPYIWSPELLNYKYEQSDRYKNKSKFFEPGRPENRNIFCTEPNVNVLKTSIFPFLATEIAYNEKGAGESLDQLYLYGANRLAAQNKRTAEWFGRSQLVKDSKVTFKYRYPYPVITDTSQVMLHHHYNNGLNYTLLEAAYLNLPIVHNSEFMTELGYYYRRANIEDAALQISRALKHEDRDDLEEYNKSCQDTIHKFSIHNEDNIRGYQTLLANLLDFSLEPVLPDYIVDLEDRLNYSDGYISPLG